MNWHAKLKTWAAAKRKINKAAKKYFFLNILCRMEIDIIYLAIFMIIVILAILGANFRQLIAVAIIAAASVFGAKKYGEQFHLRSDWEIMNAAQGGLDEFPQSDEDLVIDASWEEKDPYPWMENQTYSTCYDDGRKLQTEGNDAAHITGGHLNFDDANARLAGLRQRDKKAIDGAVSKNANYYKKHFSRELEESENRHWWGNDE